jgi:hypothetical protein
MAAELTFDAASHVYSMDGKVVPSVNQVLREMGFQEGYDKVPEYYRDRGTYVHDATCMADQGTLNFEAVPPTMRPFIRAWESWKESRDEYLPLDIEFRVCNEEFDYAGTIDRVALVNGELEVIDIKTSSSASYWHHLQIAGYEACLTEVNQGRVVYIGKDGNWKDRMMLRQAPGRWQSIIQAYNTRENRAGARSWK